MHFEAQNVLLIIKMVRIIKIVFQSIELLLYMFVFCTISSEDHAIAYVPNFKKKHLSSSIQHLF
jgi:hypothetical protein